MILQVLHGPITQLLYNISCMLCPAGYYIPTPYGYASMTYTYDSGVHVYEFFTQSLVGEGC
jgi:hypothetical protein